MLRSNVLLTVLPNHCIILSNWKLLMRCSLLLKALVMYVRYQILAIFTVALTVIYDIIVNFMPVLVLNLSLRVLHLLIVLVKRSLIHFHYINYVLLCLTVHVDGDNTRRAWMPQEYPLNFFVVQVFPSFAHNPGSLGLSHVRLIGLSVFR